MPGLMPTPISSLRAARGMSLSAPGQAQPPMPAGGGPAGAPGGVGVPRPASSTPTGWTSTGQPYIGLTPGDPTSVLTPSGPAMRQVQPGGNITEWQPNQPAPARSAGAMPLDPGGALPTSPGAAPPGESTGYGISDIMNLLSQFEPKGLPREYGAPIEDERASQAATFGRAADRIAKAGQGRVRALQSYYANRGLTGSPLEAKGVVQAKNATGGQIGDTIREQAVQQLSREQAINDRNLASQVGQRGQDLQNQQNPNWKLQTATNIGALLRQGFRP